MQTSKSSLQHGCNVQHLHTLGKGCPDLLMGCNGSNYLIEVKDSDKPASKQRLTPDQAIWHENWRGQIAVASSIEEALRVCSLS